MTDLFTKIVIATLKPSMWSASYILMQDRTPYCIAGGRLESSTNVSLTSRTISSIHLRSAGVSPASRSSLGSRNSTAPVSIYSHHQFESSIYQVRTRHIRSPLDRLLSVELQWSSCFRRASCGCLSTCQAAAGVDMAGKTHPISRAKLQYALINRRK